MADYTLIGSSNLPNAPENSGCFQQGMTGHYLGFSCFMLGAPPSPIPWTYSSHYVNANVWDSDFVDPQAKAGGGDDLYFDSPGTAIAYFAGHGVDPGCNAGAFCSSSAQCNAPDATKFQTGPGTCRSGPPGSLGSWPWGPVCCYNSDRAVVTSASSAPFGNVVKYSQVWAPDRFVGWGESAQSGGWSGVGTYGGVNLVVLDISHGVTPQFWASQLPPAFAGLQYLATIMPTAGDTSMVADRGGRFAQRWRANAAEPMANAWTYTLNDVPAWEGNSCGLVGGGHGINGCGCHFITSVDTQPRAYWKMAYGSWNSVSSDGWDGVANSYMYWWSVCNYDAATYPWAL